MPTRRLARIASLAGRMAAVALGYALLGRLGLLLTLPSELASPLYPAAGFALAVLTVHGLRYAPAVALGGFGANLWFAPAGASWLMPVVIGVGAAAQAALGASLLRRRCAQPLLLQTPRELLAFYGWGTGLACLVNASWATAWMAGAGGLPASQWLGNWTTWWVGDSLGTLIAAPVALSFLGRPAKAWHTRRLVVALPMLIATTLVGWGALQISLADLERSANVFQGEAARAATLLEAELRQPRVAVRALQGMAQMKAQPSRLEFERATTPLLDTSSPLVAAGLLRRVPRTALARFDAEARVSGYPTYSAHDRGRAGDLWPAADEDMLAIRQIAPLQRNLAALGVNIRSIPNAREATQRGLDSGGLAASAGFQLSQDRDPATGVVLYAPWFDGAGATPDERRRQLVGFAFVTLRPDLLLRRVSMNWAPGLSGCIVDDSALPRPARLAGMPGCENGAGSLHPPYRRALDFGDRHWSLLVSDGGMGPDPSATLRSWPFALVGLGATALIGSLLLLISGRAQQVAHQVRERTAALEHEAAERQQGERALRASEQRFRGIFENAPVGIAFTDFEGVYQDVNPRMCELLGRPAAELLGARSANFTHPDDVPGDRAAGQQLMRGERNVYRRNKRFLRPQGEIVQVRATVSVLRGTDGQPHRLIGVLEDLSDEVRMQQAERERQAAQAANLAKTQFLSRISHELRTPMNAILGFTQLMLLDQQESLPPGQRGRVEQIGAAGWHLLEMINDTLDLSRIESGMLRVDHGEQALGRLLGNALSLVQGLAQERGIRLDTEISTSDARVWGDATRIVQVLTNLLSNAIKYNHEGGWVQVSVRRVDAAWVELQVRDSGPGLGPEQRAALFQPFNRLGREAGNIPGTGIGLVISRHLAEMMGGNLEALDLPPPGACFVFRLRSAAAGTPDAAE